MKKRFYNRHEQERQLQQMQSRQQNLYVLFICLLGVTLLLYFCDFFNLDIDGDIQNRISGFWLSWIWLGDGLNDSDNILTLLSKKNGDKIAFAAASSCLSLLLMVGLIGYLVYRAVTKKPLFCKWVFVGMAAVGCMLVVQVVACSMLASFVDDYYYASCVTCIARTFSYIPLVAFVVFGIAYFYISYWFFDRYKAQLQPKR